jgi:exodeoxyribonuclease VII small subunit
MEKDVMEKNTMEENVKNMSIEETFSAIDELIDRLESGDGSLEEAFKNYEAGMKLVKSCNEKIEKIEKQVLVLSGEQTEEE